MITAVENSLETLVLTTNSNSTNTGADTRIMTGESPNICCVSEVLEFQLEC